MALTPSQLYMFSKILIVADSGFEKGFHIPIGMVYALLCTEGAALVLRHKERALVYSKYINAQCLSMQPISLSKMRRPCDHFAWPLRHSGACELL